MATRSKTRSAQLAPSLVVLDSSCWLEYLMDTPRADLFSDLLDNPETLLVPVIIVYEVIKKIARELGDDIASSALVLMQRSRVIEIDLPICTQAWRNGLPLADSLIYATAQIHGAALWTQDQHFKGLADVQYLDKST